MAEILEPSKLSGKTVVTAICEINGCFGHIGRDGRMQYIFLKEMVEGLYPADTLYPRDDLFPADAMNVEQISKSNYITAKYEDYTTARINKLQIRQEEDDIGAIHGTGNNGYIVQDNFLVYGKSSEELQTIAANLYSVICKVWYRPAHVEAKGNPCLEVGDGIKVHTTYTVIYSYILQRTLKGIQSLRDTYDAEGEQYQSEDVNSVHESIIQLKGKTNKLTRTIEETRSEIANIEKGLSTRITQNAEEIALEAQRASEAEGLLSARITVNADKINLKVSKDNIISEINQTAEKITIKASKIDLLGLVEADEFVSKYATLITVDAVKAELQEAIIGRATIAQLNATNAVVAEKLDATEFTADNISAMSIVVRSANVTGTFSGEKINTGEIKSVNYASSDSSYACGSGMRIDLNNGNIWWANGSIKATTGFMNSIGYEVPTANGGYNLNFKSALAIKSANYDTMLLGYGYSSVQLPSGAAVTSVVEKKTNIIPCTNALSAVENTDVYYFNYKNDTVKRDSSQKVGFIIGDGYNLDSRLLAESRDAIDTYNAIGLNWRATQQLYEKIKKQQKQIEDILSVLRQQWGEEM